MVRHVKKKGFNDYKIEGDIVIIFYPKKDGTILEGYIDLKNLQMFIDKNMSYCATYRKNIDGYYAEGTEHLGVIDGKENNKSHRMHFDIMKPPKGYKVDHINYNGLDNREENLRITTNSDNLRHRNGKNKNNNSGYRNVCWLKNENKWAVQLMFNGKNKRLGKFKELEEAAKFAEQMRKEYYGEFAGKN